jgi:hypothetical protein
MEMTDQDLSDVAALADGSLPEARRAEVEARVEASPELRQLLEKQRVALAAIGGAGALAPDALRERLARRRVRPRRRILIPVLGGAAAVTALVLALVLPDGGPEGPGAADAATFGARPPTEAAPRPYDGETALLDRTVDGVRFPRWQARFGWRTTGARVDRLDGRAAATVFYARAGSAVGYTIVAKPALPVPDGAVRTKRAGIEFRSFERDGRLVVTWQRDGRTCVLSGRAVSRDTLLALAGWRAGGRLRY